MTPEKPRHIPVNPILCQLMYEVGFIEKYGKGIYMIKELCEEYGIPVPKYEISNIETKIVFKSGGKAVVISEIKKLGVGLNEKQSESIKHIEKYGRITRTEYEKLSLVSARTASRELEELCKKGLIERKGKGPATYYLLARFGEIREKIKDTTRIKEGEIIHAQWWSYVLAPVYLMVLSVCKIRKKRLLITVHNIIPHETTKLNRFLNGIILYDKKILLLLPSLLLTLYSLSLWFPRTYLPAASLW